ncbi:MAG: Lrp/AsnC ligand binding domain-containing protein [Candidatus Jordarchaeum sp.]|uniref:Lrp/AsnC ligand binding domain-containing protein n=1 Tax=Candidatus Jordarchaeum sp. TaxID=2823881 RepID=UPI004049064C
MYVLLLEMSVIPGTEDAVFEKIHAAPEVKESHLVTGDHDIVAIIASDNLRRIYDIVMNIRKLREIVKTKTLPVMKVWKSALIDV